MFCREVHLDGAQAALAAALILPVATIGLAVLSVGLAAGVTVLSAITLPLAASSVAFDWVKNGVASLRG